MAIDDSKSYEAAVLSATAEALPVGRVIERGRLIGFPSPHGAWEADMVISPKDANAESGVYLIEVKYLKSRMVPAATVSQLMQKVQLVRDANPGVPLHFALVTNADIDTDLLGRAAVPQEISVFPKIATGDDWKNALAKWMAEKPEDPELPHTQQQQNPAQAGGRSI